MKKLNYQWDFASGFGLALYITNDYIQILLGVMALTITERAEEEYVFEWELEDDDEDVD